MPPSRTFASRSAAAVLALSACTTGAFAQRAVMTSHVPVMVHSGRAQKLQTVAVTQTLDLVLNLPLRNQAALEGLLADLYNPQSPNFHKWLSSAEFDQRFGPSAEDYAAVVAWARSSNFQIVEAAGNRRVLVVRGTAKWINRAFHVELTTYHDSVANRDFHAPDREPTLDLDVPLLSIFGLDTSAPRVNHHKAGRIVPDQLTSGSAARPVPQLTGSGPGKQYLPTDMRSAYYGSGPLTGTGQIVGIFSYDGYVASDVPLYTTKTGMAQPVPITNVLTGGFDGGCELNGACDDGEQILDIAQVQGFAPGLTKILFYEGLSAVTELNQMVMDNTAKVITSSWGGGDFGPGTTPYFMQMAAQGQTFLNATGDSGGYNGFTYLPPSSDPWIVQVGGTDLTTGTGQVWATEPAWVDSGGGYFDPSITIPSWQKLPGVITAANAGSSTLRNSPDIAAEANFDNPTVSNGTYQTSYGGTSFAAPRMAGYMALVNQASVAAGNGTIGFINPQLYDYGTRSTASSTYHDIVSGKSTSTMGNPTLTYNAVAGYDLATGWGSPNGTGLLNLLSGVDFSVAFAAPSVSVVRGNTATLDFTVTPVAGFTATPTFTFSGLPTGVTATYVSNGGNSYTATFTSASSTTVSTSVVTLTGTANSVSHSATLTLNAIKRVDADFSISATNAVVVQLGSGASNVTITPSATLSGAVSFSVTGLPAGVTASFSSPDTTAGNSVVLTLSASIASTAGSYALVVTGTYPGATSTLVHSTPITLTVTPADSVLPNGGFELTSPAWTFTSTTAGAGYRCGRECGFYPHSGTQFAYMNNFAAVDTDTLTSPAFTITAGKSSAMLNFWLWVNTTETSTTLKNDTFTVSLVNSGGTVLATLGTFSNLDHSVTYVLHSVDVSAYIGQTVSVRFTGVENRSKGTAFIIDDVSVVVQ